MDAYMYLADFYCDACAYAIKEELDSAGKMPDDPDDDWSFDSDDYPKGPFCDGGGESDTPQHCGKCHIFMENPLTEEGIECVRGYLDEYRLGGFTLSQTARDWKAFYAEELHNATPR